MAMNSQAKFEFITSYLNTIGPLIRQRNGYIDKYFSHSIVAVFRHPKDANRAALDIYKQVATHPIPIRISIGLHAAESIVGVIG
ncbi:hypothetical protein OFC56_32360, partial [Escherichia coli]|nr:hypothetical protein [Escherichia coli]